MPPYRKPGRHHRLWCRPGQSQRGADPGTAERHARAQRGRSAPRIGRYAIGMAGV